MPFLLRLFLVQNLTSDRVKRKITIAVGEKRHKCSMNSVKILLDRNQIIAELKETEKPDAGSLD